MDGDIDGCRREKEDSTISNHVLSGLIQKKGATSTALDSFNEIREALLKEKEGTLIITMGAGDIYKIAEQIIEE